MLLRISKVFYKDFMVFFFILFTASFITLNSLNAEGVDPIPEKAEDLNNKEEIQNTTITNQGLKVFIDPDTGELISQPEEEAAVVQPNNSVFGDGNGIVQQPEEIIHPDGSATVIMPESMQHSTKITIDENGKQTTECNRKYEHTHE